jgi:phosphoenolpyruvate-protein phosphotransferase (PTS system enzyme I)
MAESSKEVVLQGIGVSPGVVVGKAFLLTTDEDRIVEREISSEDIPREIARFEEALIETRRQIHEIQHRVGEAMGQESAGIFDAHLLVVDDHAFVEEVIRGLSAYHRNVESVLHLVTERYAEALGRIEDDYLRERAVDVRDVSRRIMRNLSGKSSSILTQLREPRIVIANDLAPSETAQMMRDTIIGFATDLGSPTSHTAIMARALTIPAIVGLHDVSVRISEGDTILLDGNKGVLIIHPSEERLERYGKVIESRKTIESELANLKDKPAETKDGYVMLLSANIARQSDVEAVLQSGARGVGLFRSEFLYLAKESALPDEEEQVQAYKEVAERIYPDQVIIRTIDLGGDKFLSHIKTPPELNPFMGWRAIRFCLAQPAIFKTQLRAILRASASRNVKMMYPMVSNVDEVLKANALLDEAKNECREAGHAFNDALEVGVMIEVPSAAIMANLLAPHVKFFSLGTNDLVQYTLAADRVNERIAYLYEPTHPAILRLIKNTIDVGHAHGIWTGICGEMAGNPLMVPLLMGLGADELSVSPSLVPLVKDVIRNIRYAQAEELGVAALRSVSPKEVLDLCRDLTHKVAPEILELVE